MTNLTGRGKLWLFGSKNGTSRGVIKRLIILYLVHLICQLERLLKSLKLH